MTARQRISALPADIVFLHADSWTEPFWRAAAEHRLVVPRCRSCGTFRFPPGPFCPNCRQQDVDWIELSGRGRVFTYTVTRRALLPVFEAVVPYAVAVVELDEAPGVRLVGAMVDVSPESVHHGMEVVVAWDDIDDQISVPRFRPAT